MEQKHKRVSRIENYLSMLLTKAGISENLFIGNMPATMSSGWSDMVLIDVLQSKDYDAYAEGTANIFLYAKALDSLSRKPMRKLDMMEQALQDALDSANDKHYVVSVNWRDSDYDENRNYYYNVVNINVTAR